MLARPGEAMAAQRHQAALEKGFGHSTLEGLNLERRGTVELDPDDTEGWNAWVRYHRDDGKWAWVSQTELADALMRMEDDGSTYNKKAKVDGKSDMTWVYTYDAEKNRLRHDVLDVDGKTTTVCTYKKCPPPYEDKVCFRRLKCKR